MVTVAVSSVAKTEKRPVPITDKRVKKMGFIVHIQWDTFSLRKRKICIM